MKKNFFLALACNFLCIASANATTYTFNENFPPGNIDAGRLSNFSGSYDTDTEIISLSYTIQSVGGQLSDGFWLAVNDGPNPKGTRGELALLYGDIDAGVITAYEFNGQNADNSYLTPANYLGTFGLTSVDNGTISRTVTFSIDATAINGLNLSADWTGLQFGTEIGYWFHPVLGGNFSYDGNNHLTNFSYSAQGWYDAANHSTEVPEPGTLVLIGSGLLGLCRRRNHSAV